MSDTYREEHPLLHDDLSEEEHFNPLNPRRFRPAVYRSRARNSVKGAAAIITRWPDHWSSFTYLWIGLGMVAIATFIIFNAVVVGTILPKAQSKATTPYAFNKFLEKIPHRTSNLPEVYMHLLVNPNEKLDLNKYLPYIEIMSNKYRDFKYNLILVVNDSSSDALETSAEERNKIAFDYLWNKDIIYDKQNLKRNNIDIQYVSLSNYMNKSPLSKYWRHLPYQFIEFLIRAIAVWNKGGIAFNPILLTPQSPYVVYIGKIENILERFGKINGNKTNESIAKKHLNKQEKVKSRVNNIQDIIEILEHEDVSYNSSQYSLTEAEDRNNLYLTHNGLKFNSLNLHEIKNRNETKSNVLNHITVKPHLSSITEEVKRVIRSQRTNEYQEIDKVNQTLENNQTSKLSLLPLFINFLFRDPAKSNQNYSKNEEKTESETRPRKSVIPVNNMNILSRHLQKTDTKLSDNKPMIIAAQAIKNEELLKDTEAKEIHRFKESAEKLTIDLKGLIIATETACHAFLGTVFSNAIHHTEEESLEDFIIAELSIFCHGLLSSCKGIDLILP